MIRPIASAAAVAVAVASFPGCSAGQRASLDRNGVTVSARLSRQSGQLVVLTTFRPDKAGFHIYALELPDGGVDGLGTPTRIAPGPGLQRVADAKANEPTVILHIDQLHVDLPVYPPGPVEVSMAARTIGSVSPTVIVSYGACSATLCLAPVRDETVQVTNGSPDESPEVTAPS